MQENILFEINEHWTYEQFKKADTIFQRKIRKNYRLCIILSIFLIAFCFVMNVWLYCGSGQISFVALLGTLMGVAFLCIIPVVFEKKTKNAWKLAPDVNGYEEKIEFYENYFAVRRSDGEIRFPYDKFTSLIDKSDYLYLLVSKDFSLKLQKEQCSMELLSFLNEKYSK